MFTPMYLKSDLLYNFIYSVTIRTSWNYFYIGTWNFLFLDHDHLLATKIYQFIRINYLLSLLTRELCFCLNNSIKHLKALFFELSLITKCWFTEMCNSGYDPDTDILTYTSISLTAWVTARYCTIWEWFNVFAIEKIS